MSPELEALLSLEQIPLRPGLREGDASPAQPPKEPRQEPKQRVNWKGEPSKYRKEKSGRFPPDDEPPVRSDVYDVEYREKIVAFCLPKLRDGASLRDLSASLGVNFQVLQGWLIVQPGTEYQEALAGQVGARLSRYASEMEECAVDSAQAVADVKVEKKTVLQEAGERTGARYALTGPALAQVVGVRSGVLERAAGLWKWIAERRLPRQFGDAVGAAGPTRASFVFIVDGRRREVGLGAGRPIIEQAAEGPGAFDIMPDIRTPALGAPDQGGVIPNSAGTDAPDRDPVTTASGQVPAPVDTGAQVDTDPGTDPARPG